MSYLTQTSLKLLLACIIAISPVVNTYAQTLMLCNMSEMASNNMAMSENVETNVSHCEHQSDYIIPFAENNKQTCNCDNNNCSCMMIIQFYVPSAGTVLLGHKGLSTVSSAIVNSIDDIYIPSTLRPPIN